MDILSFCYQRFLKDKICIILHRVYGTSVKYDNVASYTVLLGMIAGKCFPLTAPYSG